MLYYSNSSKLIHSLNLKYYDFGEERLPQTEKILLDADWKKQ